MIPAATAPITAAALLALSGVAPGLQEAVSAGGPVGDTEPLGFLAWISIVIALLGEILAVGFVVRLLSSGGSTAATLLWTAVILLAPWLGLAMYYLLARRVHMRRLRRRRNQLDWMEEPMDRLREMAAGAGDGGPAAEGRPLASSGGPEPRGSAERLLLQLDPDAVRDGNAVELLADGKAFFSHAAAAIDEAREFVHLEVYIFRPDEVGLAVLERLTDAARRGVEVRLLYDSFGSFGLKAEHLAPLIGAGGKATAFLPLFWRRRPFTLNLRNHRKLLVVDGATAWLGGRNVGVEYARDLFGRSRKWLDSMVAVRGPIVRRLHRVFVEDWYNASEEDLCAARYFPEPEVVGDDQVGVVSHGPDDEISPLYYVWHEIAASARHELRVSSPYCLPPAALLVSLRAAALRGVRVVLHTNGKGVAQAILYRAQRSHYRALLEAGVEIRENREDYNHAKLLIADRTRLFIGSANLDARSAELNFELGVVVSGSALLDEVVELFDRRAAGGYPIAPSDLPRTPIVQALDGIARLFSPLL